MYWDITSSIDWCEENYTHSYYIVEFWNTMTSTSMFFTGLYLYYNDKSNSRLQTLYYLLCLVGIGSVLFHMTLSRYSQALDEVPMIWLAICLINTGVESLVSIRYTNTIMVVYGCIVSLGITLQNDNVQFYTFHASNILVNLGVVFVFYKLAHKYNLYNIYKRGVGYFATGLVFWILDLILCHYLQETPLHS